MNANWYLSEQEKKSNRIFRQKTMTAKITDNELDELEIFFNKYPLPKIPVKINTFTIVNDCESFIKYELSTLRRSNQNDTFLSSLYRLRQLKCIIKRINGIQERKLSILSNDFKSLDISDIEPF